MKRLILLTNILILLSGCAALQSGGNMSECRKLCQGGQSESYKDDVLECVCRKDALK